MQVPSRSLIFAAAIGAPLVLAGCVEPAAYYQQPGYAVYPDAGPAYAAPAPYYYPAPAYVEPSVYVGVGGGWHDGWHDHGWRR